MREGKSSAAKGRPNEASPAACRREETMTVSIKPLHPVFVGEALGADLTKPMSKDDVAAIEAGMDRYAVLVFPDQRIDDEQQMAFTRNFGEIEGARGGNITKPHELRRRQGMVDVSNLDKDGKPLPRDDRRRMFNLGNRLWHSDSSFRAIPAKYSLLSARTVATSGGNTEFADMRAAYDTLDDDTRTMVEDLICEHSLIYSRGSMGFTELTEEERAAFKPVRQRLVRTHPVSGRKSLYLSSHIGSIVGWPVPEARDFLRDLTEHATQRERVHIHRWRPYDLVMWDNRQTMHRVRPFDESQPRDVRRTTVRGDAPTAAQAETQAA
jgi:alpha-ketoglutarate-dependent 2,4-dichlorophenoxyacetate dioxygenase